MKIKTNVRAGAGNQKRGTSTDSTSTSTSTPDVVIYYPPVSRCVGV